MNARKSSLFKKPPFPAVMRSIWLLQFAFFLSLFVSIQGWATGGGNHALLVTPPSSVLGQLHTNIKSGPEVVRSRLVTIDFGPLVALDNSAANNQVLLQLDLFEDISVTAVVTQTKSASRESVSWIGYLEDDPESQVTLVKSNDILQGNITSQEGMYQIRYVTRIISGTVIHAVRQIDPSQFPPEHPPGFESGVLHSDEFLPEHPLDFEYGVQQGDVAGDDGSVIDVMVVYTPAARSAVGGTAAMNTLVDLAVTESNSGYSNSGISTTLNLVHKVEVSYTESGNFSIDLNRLEGKTDGYMDNVHTLRDTYKADMVGLLIDDSTYCGLASTIMATESQAFQVTHYDCATGYYSFAHEFGHLQGARHDWRVDPTDNSPFTYNHGYVKADQGWRTIMAYNDPACSSGYCTRLKYWSNPDVSYGAYPMGVPEGSYHAADNRKTINNTAYTVANFRISGGTPSMTSPTPGSTLSGATETFSWSDNGASVSEYWLYIGTTGVGSKDILDSSQGTSTSATVSGLPTDGSTVYVRFWYKISGSWLSQDYTYTAFAGGGTPGITSPTPGSTLSGATETFTWSDNGASVSKYWLYIGSSVGASDIHNSGDLGTATSTSVSGLPTDGSTVYVRLWYQISGSWLFQDYTYTAFTAGGTPGITSPTPGSTLSGATETFTWSDNGASVSKYWLYIGSSVGGKDIHDSGDLGTATSTSVSGLPTDGSTVYVRFWYYIGVFPILAEGEEVQPSVPVGSWYYIDYTYTAASSISGFNSQFNGDASGWFRLGATAPWSIQSNAWYYTEGVADEFASTYYGSYSDSNTMYGDFSYEARFWRSGCSTCSNGLMFRGNPSPSGSGYRWDHGYGFYYSMDGDFAIFKYTGGSATTLLTWTASTAINQGSAWNTLKVEAFGTTIDFYINGTHVATLISASYTNGKAGLIMYRDSSSSGNGLWVDWATLVSSGASSDDYEHPTGEVKIIDEAAAVSQGNADTGVGEQPKSINSTNSGEVEAQ